MADPNMCKARRKGYERAWNQHDGEVELIFYLCLSLCHDETGPLEDTHLSGSDFGTVETASTIKLDQNADYDCS